MAEYVDLLYREMYLLGVKILCDLYTFTEGTSKLCKLMRYI